MSLLILDPDIAAADALCGQLSDLEFECIATSQKAVAVELCRKGGVQLLVTAAADILDEIDRFPVGVGIVYVSHGPVNEQLMLRCMQQGVHDCWQLPMQADALRMRAADVLAKMRVLIKRVGSELREMRSELERDQRAGQYIQLGMLPPNPMDIGHFRLEHKIEPSLILSGDFVDYFQITNRHFACYVADVAGHGASSAFVTVLLKNFSRRLRREYQTSMLTNAGEILAWINNELIDQQIDKHVAMFVGVVDTRENVLHFANAAHFPPAMVVHEDQVLSLEQAGKPLGLFADVKFGSLRVPFVPGDRLVVFSDGVLDLMAESSLEAKEQNLRETALSCSDMESLWSAFDASKLGPDDVSCLLVSYEQ